MLSTCNLPYTSTDPTLDEQMNKEMERMKAGEDIFAKPAGIPVNTGKKRNKKAEVKGLSDDKVDSSKK